MALRAPKKKASSVGALKAALASVAKRPSTLEKLCGRKTLSASQAATAQRLMERAQPMPSAGRASMALVVNDFAAAEDWQLSVARGEEVAVLDKLDDGWDYDDADLEAAFAYLDLLIHGDPFSTGPAPPRFNELCASSSEFAARVKAHADDSRRRASDDEDPLGDLG
ncbi:hypothetical protein JL721_6916 [Aureococcus anophagefferens]|nr:hypothetical protein JL721_6916 [Aureococcus anophagefferens]